MTKKTKLKNLLNAFANAEDKTSEGFKAFDVGVEKLKSQLREKIQVSTLEEVNSELEKFRKKIDLDPLMQAFEQIKQEISSRDAELTNDIESRLETLRGKLLEASLKNSEDFGSTREKISALESQLKEVANRKLPEFPDFNALIKDTEARLNKLIKSEVKEIKDSDKSEELKKLINELEETLRRLRIDLIARINERGGGNARRQIKVDGVDVLTKYTDINLVAGAGITLSAANDNTDKNVDITITSTADLSVTLADVSALSTDATKSLYTMTAGVPVEFRSSDGNTILYIDETNEFIRATKLVGSTSTTGDLTLQTTTGVGAAGADMHFLVGNNGATEAMTILNSGNVGIGTTSPGKALDINSATGANLRLTYNDSDGSATNYADLLTTSGGNLTIDASGGTTSILDTTASTSTVTGSLINAGGFGNAGAFYNGGIVRFTDNTASTSTTTGALVVTGGIGVGGSIFVSNRVQSGSFTQNAQNATAISLGGGGTNYGTIQVENGSPSTWSLGYQASQGSTIGTAVLSWDENSLVTTAGDLKVTGGNVGVGGAVSADVGLYLHGNNLTTTTQYGSLFQTVFNSSATSAGYAGYFQTITAASAFTMTAGYGLFVATPTVGATSAITTQTGLLVQNQGASGVTNAYGIDIQAQSGAATINLGFRNQGRSLFGTTAGSYGALIDITGSVTGSTYGMGIYLSSNVTGTTQNTYGIYSTPTLTAVDTKAATSFLSGGIVAAGTGLTIANAHSGYFAAMTKTGTGTVTNAYGVYIEAPTIGGTTNIGLYNLGTSRFDGTIGLGTTPSTGNALLFSGMALAGTIQTNINAQNAFSSAATSFQSVVYGKVTSYASPAASSHVFYAETPVISAGSITTQSGLTVANQGATGITNAYGIDIAAQSGAATTNVGLRNAGTTLLTNNTASTSTTTGALVVTGGIGVGGSIFVSNRVQSGSFTQNAQNATAISLGGGGTNYGTIQVENGSPSTWSLGYQASQGTTIGTKVLSWNENGLVTTSGNLSIGGYSLRSVGNALTAAGTTRADALQLAKEVNNVTTAAAGTGVILPVGVIGMRIVIFNNGANAIQVYASASETIDGTAGATGVPLTNAKRCEYFFTAANTWISAQLGVVSA